MRHSAFFVLFCFCLSLAACVGPSPALRGPAAPSGLVSPAPSAPPPPAEESLPKLPTPKGSPVSLAFLKGKWVADSGLQDHPSAVLFVEMEFDDRGNGSYTLIQPDSLYHVVRALSGKASASVREGRAALALEKAPYAKGGLILPSSALECAKIDAETLSCTGYFAGDAAWNPTRLTRGEIWQEEYSHIPGSMKGEMRR